MIALAVAILMVVLPLLHLALSKVPRTPLRVIHILLLYALVFGVGVIGLPLGFIPHVFFPDKAAELIGWAPSPFQLEVGVHDGAWGILGFLCIWIGGLFWLATGLGWSFFMLGATYGHIRETVIEGDYAPYNFFTIFSDGFIGGLAARAALPLLPSGRLPEVRPPAALQRVATGAAIPDILLQGGWQQARSSPTGSGPEGSSPNEIDAGCSSSLPPLAPRISLASRLGPAWRRRAFDRVKVVVHGRRQRSARERAEAFRQEGGESRQPRSRPPVRTRAMPRLPANTGRSSSPS